MLIGGIDLSMGATIGLASVCGAFTMHYTDSSLLGLLACLATGGAIGALNGFGVARGGLQPFIMTFGMMLTVRAVAFLLTGGFSVGKLPKALLQTGRMNVAGLPLVFVLGLAVALFVGLVLSRTVFGAENLSYWFESPSRGIFWDRRPTAQISSLPDRRRIWPGRRPLCS